MHHIFLAKRSNLSQFIYDKDSLSLASRCRLHYPESSFLFEYFREHDILTRQKESQRYKIPLLFDISLVFLQLPLMLSDILYHHVFPAKLNYIFITWLHNRKWLVLWIADRPYSKTSFTRSFSDQLRLHPVAYVCLHCRFWRAFSTQLWKVDLKVISELNHKNITNNWYNISLGPFFSFTTTFLIFKNWIIILMQLKYINNSYNSEKQ